jgi:N-ethylmaleimide reductase
MGRGFSPRTIWDLKEKIMNIILSPFYKQGLHLKNHLVMAPMTRSRAIDNLPNDLMAAYYGQRSGAGLIITEGTAPMPGDR